MGLVPVWEGGGTEEWSTAVLSREELSLFSSLCTLWLPVSRAESLAMNVCIGPGLGWAICMPPVALGDLRIQPCMDS